MSETTKPTTQKKGTSTTSITIKRLREKQLNLVFGALTYDELVSCKKSLETALIPAKKVKIEKLEKELEEAKKA